jgi:O-antigen ligase
MCKFAFLKSLRFYEKTEFFLLLLLAIFIPIWWRMAICFVYLLLVNTVIKICFSHNIGNRTLNTNIFVSLFLVISFVVVYALSLFYSTNLKEGATSIVHHLTLIFLALFFLLSDMSYIRKIHIDIILYSMTFIIVGRFLIFLLLACKGYFFVHHDVQLAIGSYFDPMHHAYLSMYILLSLVFLYIQLGGKTSYGQIIFILISILLLVTYIFFLQARMGVIVVILFFAAAAAHQFFFRRRYVASITAVVVLGLSGWLVLKTVSPLMTHRIKTIATFFTDERQNDERYVITQASFNIIKRNPVFGVGVGDRMDEMVSEYNRLGVTNPTLYYNPHNQYIDTLMTTGVFGLTLLLAILAIPLIAAIRSKNILHVSFLIIIAMCSLSESILERQMGMVFFGFFYGLLAYYTKTAPYEICSDNRSHKETLS